MATAIATTTTAVSNTTHIYDTYDLFIHPHWKQFPLIPDFWHYAIGVFITFVGISGTLGNLLVIYIFGTTKSLRTPSNMFVVNLALSDLTFSAVNGFPLLTLSAFNKRWIFGKVACELYGLIGGIFGLMSINTMAMIAIDRYNVIARPIKASHSLSYRKAFIMIVLVWVWSLVWTLPPLFGWGAYIPEGFQTSCTFDYLTRNDYFRSYIMCLYICGFAIPLCIILFCYFFIYRAVAEHEKEMGKMAKKLNAEIRQGQAQQKAEIKTAKIAMTIIVTYLLSWTPYATVALIAQFGNALYVTPYVSELPVMFAKASAMHNPIIYALSHPRFREVLNTRFPWLLCCCQYSAKEAEAAVQTKTTKAGGGTSNMDSEVSNVTDDTTIAAEGGSRQVSMKMSNMGGQPENNGALIRDILQAFVGVVNAQGTRQVPVYVPPQYMAQLPPQVAAAAAGQQPVYHVPAGTVASPPVMAAPPAAPVAQPAASVSQPVAQPAAPVAQPAPPAAVPAPLGASGPAVVAAPAAAVANSQSEAETGANAHDNPAFQKE